MPVCPSSLSAKFSTSDLSDQFILCQSKELVPDGWVCSTLGSWIVGHHKSLSVVCFGEEATGLRGWLLGYAIDPLEGDFIFGLAAPPRIPALVDFEVLEGWLSTLSGRFAAIVFSSAGSRVYLDASGSLSAIYSKHRRICASSPMLIPYDEETDDDVDLINAMLVPESNRFYAFGLTPRHNILRLLPNHYLDLDTWIVKRHWPHGPLSPTAPLEVVTSVSCMLAGTIRSVCNHGQPFMSLTAGRDSRMLLACAKDMVSRVQFFTWELRDQVAKTDLRVAKNIKDKYGLRHKTYSFSEAGLADKEKWLYRTGCAVGETRGLSLVTTVNSMDPDCFYLPGLASEVGRSFYWKDQDTDELVLTAEEIVTRLSLPPVQKIIESAREWLIDLPLTECCDVLDFLYIEQRLGCWAGVTAYGDADGPYRLPPFSNRTLFALMIGLPCNYRRTQQLATDIVLANWPELMDNSPFNPMTFREKMRSYFSKWPLVWPDFDTAK